MNPTFFTILALLLITSNIINIDAALNTSSLLINCGLPKPTKSYVDGSLWQSDDDPSFAPPNLNTVSTVVQDPMGEWPYQVGRVFWSNITYTFSITPAGPIFLRLYFFPNLTFNNTLPHQFSISLFANNFTLFNNFNPFLNSPIHNSNFYEFQLILENGEKNLNLTFSPAPADAPSSIISYGYVNGIEIESIPEGLYIDETNLNYRYVLDTKDGYQLDLNSAAFQTAFRLNVGGELVSGAQDNPGGMRRTWEADDAYLVGPHGVKYQPGIDTNSVIIYTKTPPYVAAKLVYETVRIMGDNVAQVNLGRNLTWVFKVDPGFDYVVRFHWREMDLNVTGTEQRLMRVYIGGYVAEEGIDIWDEAGGLNIPIYKDYVITIPGTSNGTKVPLSLALHPNLARITDVTLNGVEILKLSSPDKILAVPNPPYNGSDDPTNPQNQAPNRKSPIRKMMIIIGGVIGGVLLASMVLVALLRRRVQHKKLLASSTKSSSNGQWIPLWVGSRSTTATTKPNNSSRASSLPSDLCRRFSLSEIRVATSDFDEGLVIGTGGFGKVYKGIIDEGASTVAIKRLNSTSKQGEHEFLTEIEMLSRLRHLHLVSLIGYCEEQSEMILVYEYMPRGTLRDHLHYKDAKGKGDENENENENDEVLPWKQRLMICIGSARGLDYLHSGAKQVIIHRDVKSTNILLDDKWTAKVSDFGLSKVGPASDTGVGHVSTVVKGSFGYLDPEYYKRGQLSEKSDVFSFGVVLFEVLCARPAVSPSLPKEQMNLAKWARSCYKKGMLHTIVDPNLTGQIAPECLRKFGETADMCLKSSWDERPTMKDIVWSLEFALTLQQTAEKNTRIGSSMVNVSSNDNAIDNVDCGGGGGFVRRYDENISQSSGVEGASKAFGSSSGSDATTNTTVTNYHMDFKSGSVFSEILDPRAR